MSSAVNYFQSIIPNSSTGQSISSSTSANIIYPTNIYNNGWGINTSAPANTIFTCPATGSYLILSTTYFFDTAGNGGSPITVSILKNSTVDTNTSFGGYSSTGSRSFTFTYLMAINQNDTISIKVTSQSLPGSFRIRAATITTNTIAGSLTFVKIV